MGTPSVMSKSSRKEYLAKMRSRYPGRGPEGKSRLLDEVCEVCGYERKYAIRLMNQNALVLDLRPADAFANGHLAGARNLPPDQILKAGETLKKYKEKPVVVYDESGSLSVSAARQLAAQGFTKAVNLRGGLVAWRTENLPLTKG